MVGVLSQLVAAGGDRSEQRAGCDAGEGQPALDEDHGAVVWHFCSGEYDEFGLAAGLVGALAVAAAILLLAGTGAAVRAERILPPHTAPGAPFPVVIRLTGEVDAPNTVLVRDELTGDAEATGPAIDGEAKQFGKNPRWIGHLRRGRAVFPYLVQPGKKLGPDDEIRFSGDIIAGEGQTKGDSIDGASRIRLAPYHWADTDKDYVISDSEIRKAYATYSVPGESLVNFAHLEELWVAGRYTWNRKTRTFAAGGQ